LTFDLAAVTNQAGWLLTEAGCIQALTDIMSWTNTAGGGGGAGLATEVTQVLVKDAVEAIKADLDATVRTAGLLVVSGVANTTVAAGARSVTFSNQGPTAATVAGGVLDAGESITFNAGAENDTLAAIAYISIATGVLKIATIL
jgi:hypothetical protein